MKLAEVSRGIPHIEDLPVRDIIDIILDIDSYQITEKVDGAQILFGIDDYGFYTSRESKGGKRIYNESEYEISFSSSYKRSAHKLLESILPLLKSAGLREGDQVEAEVLFGHIPNVVPYSADMNYLIFLRTTKGTVNIDFLREKLVGQSTSVPLLVPITEDGKNIIFRETSLNWKLTRVPIIKKTINSQLLSTYLCEINAFVNTKDLETNLTFMELLETPLNKIPKWVTPGTWGYFKEHIKSRKIEIGNIFLEDYMFPLKEILLNNLVRETASAFGSSVEDGGLRESVAPLC